VYTSLYYPSHPPAYYPSSYDDEKKENDTNGAVLAAGLAAAGIGLALAGPIGGIAAAEAEVNEQEAMIGEVPAELREQIASQERSSNAG
jgi:hypothetical protein